MKLNPSNFCSEISMVCLFLANLYKFKIFLDQLIFVVKKRLIYEETSIFDEELNATKIKLFA